MKNLRIIYVLFVFLALFISLTLYLTYIEIFDADTYLKEENMRDSSFQNKVLRGKITDINGTVIAKSDTFAHSYKEIKPGNKYPLTLLSQKRTNLFSEYYLDITGVHYNIYDEPDRENPISTNLELMYDKHLTSSYFTDDIVTKTNAVIHKYTHKYTTPTGDEKILSGSIKEGNTLKLTINHNLQEYAYSLLEKYKGKNAAIVMTNPTSGAILAMAYCTDKNTNVFLPTDNHSAPGSVFKVISAASIIENGYSGIRQDNMSLTEAFIKSKNSYFIKMFEKIGYDKLYETAEEFLFNKEIHAEHLSLKSTITEKSTNYQEAMGQGIITSSPLGMCLVANAIANNGKMMQPYIADSIISSNGKVTLYSTTPLIMNQCVSESTADTIKEMMYQVVHDKSGTGKNAYIKGFDMCGKTGTVQRIVSGNLKNDAWFIGFGPKDNPEISVCVMIWDVVVNEDSGGKTAAPIARQMINKYIELYK